MYFMKIALMIGGGAFALAGLAAQAAPVSPLEVKIELRVLDFISEPADRSAVAVLYDRDHPASAEEAAGILRALQDSAGLARVKIAPRLVEIRSGQLATIAHGQLRAAFTGAFSATEDVESLAFLGGETVGAMMDRCLPAFDDLLADPSWRCALLVLHGGINRALLGHALTGGRSFLGRLEQSPACINVLDIGADDVVVRATNLVPTQWLQERERFTTMEKLLAQYLRGAGGGNQ